MGSTALRFGAAAPLIEELRNTLQAASTSPERHRSVRAPGDVVGILEPHFAECGITRVADLTGLDVVGIPVFAAYRPNSRSLAVSMGKGLEPGRARLGAVMECLEQVFSECAEDIVVARGSRREMMARGRRCIDPSTFLRNTAGKADDDVSRSWVLGLSATTFDEVLAPFELVGLDLREDAGWDRSAYRMTSIGLAAGTSMAGAALNALLEVVENDATAPLEMLGFNPPFAQPLAHEEGLDGDLDGAVAKVRSAELTCSFYALTGRVDLPVAAALVTPEGKPHGATAGRVFAGFACRPTVPQAALAALLEAVQSRLTHISGARDDLAPSHYRAGRGDPRRAGSPIAMAAGSHRSFPASAGTTVAGQLRQALAATLSRGSDVFLFPLGGIGNDARVVRVLVPEMQAAAPDGPVRLGAGSLAMLLAAFGERK